MHKTTWRSDFETFAALLRRREVSSGVVRKDWINPLEWKRRMGGGKKMKFDREKIKSLIEKNGSEWCNSDFSNHHDFSKAACRCSILTILETQMSCLGSALAISHWNYGSFFSSGTVLHRLSWKMMKIKDYSPNEDRKGDGNLWGKKREI